MHELYIMEVMEQTMADGPGLRTSIYCAGCEHHCPGCHNPQSWKFENGHKMSIDDLMQVIKDDDISNVSFSGGDPFYQVEGFTELARRIKTETNKTIWCWTGFTYEEILADSHLSMLLPYLDVLVDGPYIEALRDTQLHFRGSSNQRIIHLTPEEDDEIPGTVKSSRSSKLHLESVKSDRLLTLHIGRKAQIRCRTLTHKLLPNRRATALSQPVQGVPRTPSPRNH